ncbi:MAG: polyphosphate kinase 1 [Ignavibacteria bacterium]|nr:polyphosphate kinase 1 [Ignavibacteria bacterium]
MRVVKDSQSAAGEIDFSKAHKELRRRFSQSERLFNRELRWFDFNNRVLEEACDPTVPVLERLKFLAIFASNLDEFFMVRAAFVRRQVEARITKRGEDGLRPSELMEEIVKRVHKAHENIGQCYRTNILPHLRAARVMLVSDTDATEEQRAFVAEYFRTTLHALITPLAIDASHPFPQMENGALYFCAELLSRSASERRRGSRLVLLRIPTNAVGRFVRIPVPKGTVNIMMIDDVIRLMLREFFSKDGLLGCYQIKIVRDSELDLDEVGSADLMKSILDGLARRRKGATTRFLHDPSMPPRILEKFAKQLKLSHRHMFPGARHHSFSDLMQIPSLVERPDLMYKPMPPLRIRLLDSASSIIGEIHKRDILLHHPYQSFSYVSRFFEEAANDNNVVAIKATLYRIANESRLAAALGRAARAGIHVTVLIELKARFDEEHNILWARTLEEAGAHVIYGVKRLKTHSKVVLVVRKEGKELRRYCHLGTGNYNDRTARIYSDLGLLTANPGITSDVENLFNRITGAAEVRQYRYLLVAPEFLREEFVKRIRREAKHARRGRPARIVAKMNSLVDPGLIDELYVAGQAGVHVQLIVRGICCLRPGVPGLSDNIEVTSIIDRYLEHARVYRFENGGEPELFLSSADWMPRNLNSRIEIAFPILDRKIRNEVEAILDIQLRDNVKARLLRADGTNQRRRGNMEVRSQFRLYEIAQQLA